MGGAALSALRYCFTRPPRPQPPRCIKFWGLRLGRLCLRLSRPEEEEQYKSADVKEQTLLKFRTAEPIEGQRNFRGRLIGLAGENVRFEADGRGELEVPFDKIVKANIEYEF